jgi:site-specific DNA-methyltransferase (adenine-specific)
VRRLLSPEGTLYFHIDYREAHYCKLLLDELFGRECFLNELIWAYDYGAKPRRRWPAKHDTILVYVKDPERHFFDCDAVDREPYMAPGLVTPEQRERGKRPSDTWWHTIVSPTGREKTGYPTQKPEGIVRRMVQASSRPGDLCLDPFAGSGTLGAVAAKLGRRYLLIDVSPEAVAVIGARLGQNAASASPSAVAGGSPA